MRKKLLAKTVLTACVVLGMSASLINIPAIYEKEPSIPPITEGTSLETEENTSKVKATAVMTDTYVYDIIEDNRPNSTKEPTPEPTIADTYAPPTTQPISDLTPTPTSEPEPTISETPTPAPNTDIQPEPTETVISEEPADKLMLLYIAGENSYVELPLEEYITGVVLAEMSYLSEVEALRAQAVAARTFCLNRLTNTPDTHPLSAVCDRASHCMGYYSREEILKKYGDKNGSEIWQKVNDIVISTEGEYLTYNGKIISAMFHDSSYGCTESCENLYGYPKDYLVCVKTPEEKTEYTQTFTIAKVIKSLFENTSELKDLTTAVGNITRFEDSGRCESIEIYGKKFTGLQVFIALGLRSMDFDVTYNGNEFVFVCRGFGHGIGMSQKGANIYAQMGLDYREILFHYYTGCEIENLWEEK